MTVLMPPPHIDSLPVEDPVLQAQLQQLAAVAAQLGLAGRITFGLDHRHFDVDAGEVMRETTDVTERVHTVRPVARAEVPDGTHYVTAWRVAADGTLATSQICSVLRPDSHDRPPGMN